MIQDLHSHTYYSFCGKDSPIDVIETAIKGGIQMLGLSDHSYGIGISRPETANPDDLAFVNIYQRCLNAYNDHQKLLKNLYSNKIKIKCGVEIPTLDMPYLILHPKIDISNFDYCLVEHIDMPNSVCENIFDFAKRCGTEKVGIAHTDLPAFLEAKEKDKLEFFTEMAKRGIFWELNVNYDSIHGFREHAYVKKFFQDEKLQEIVLKSGVELSVGFDGHKIEDYLPKRVEECCRKVSKLGIPMVFEKE